MGICKVPRMARPRRSLTVTAATFVAAAAAWWRKHPSPCPYGQRFWVQAPHPIITRKRLLKVLVPRPGEQLLEVGPGTGYYSLPVAAALADGRLAIVDIQQEMLDHTTGSAARAGLGNVEPTRADARDLPYPDDTFDGAYIIAALGEIPEPDAALSELARVLKPNGRLVVGELFGDPHMVTFGSLSKRAREAGLEVQRRLGGPLGYFALLTPLGGRS